MFDNIAIDHDIIRQGIWYKYGQKAHISSPDNRKYLIHDSIATTQRVQTLRLIIMHMS